MAMFGNIVAKTLSSKGQLAIKIDQFTCGWQHLAKKLPNLFH
jgi:hypothetical protein